MNKMKFLLPKEKRKNRKHCRRSGAQCPSARVCKVDAPSPKPRALLHKNTGVIGTVTDAPLPVLVLLVFLLFFHGASSFEWTFVRTAGRQTSVNTIKLFLTKKEKIHAIKRDVRTY